MLEAKSHAKLKLLLKQFSSSSEDNLTLSRLVARSLRRKEQTLIELDVNNKVSWWPGLLIPLSIESFQRILVLTEKEKNNLLNNEVPILKENGMDIKFWDKDSPPTGKTIWILSYKSLILNHHHNLLHSRQIIIPYADELAMNLREAMSIRIKTKNWNELIKSNPDQKDKILNLYTQLSRKLFSQASSIDCNVRIDCGEIFALKTLIKSSEGLIEPWQSLIKINQPNWGSWAELNHQSLSWTWHIQPLEPINYLQNLVKLDSLVLITKSYTSKDLMSSKLYSNRHKNSVIIDLRNKGKGKKISLFAPKNQPLPNSKNYKKHLLNQSKKLIIGMNGLTILIIDDNSLLLSIASELAGGFGKRIAYETVFPSMNGVICCRSPWWIKHQKDVPSPKQLIFGLLPIESLSLPLTAAKVEFLKQHGRDWFRELLLPDALNVITKSTASLRHNSGLLAVLDGRLRSRSWGSDFLESLQPIQEIHHLFPYETF